MPTRWAGRRATVQEVRAGKSRVKRIECVFFVDFNRKIIDQFRIVQGMRHFFEYMPLNFDFSEGRTRVRVLPECPRRRRGIAVARGRGDKAEPV